jgi:flagellar export protein FliJ
MKRFKFRLEAVEKVRKKNEEDAMRVLSDARRRLSDLVARGEEQQQALQSALNRREKLGLSPTAPAEYHTEEDFIVGTKFRIAQIAQQILKAQKGVEKATRFFIHARRQLHVITTLREREHEAFRKEQQRREQKSIDEMVVMRSNRERMEEAG